MADKNDSTPSPPPPPPPDPKQTVELRLIMDSNQSKYGKGFVTEIEPSIITPRKGAADGQQQRR